VREEHRRGRSAVIGQPGRQDRETRPGKHDPKAVPTARANGLVTPVSFNALPGINSPPDQTEDPSRALIAKSSPCHRELIHSPQTTRGTSASEHRPGTISAGSQLVPVTGYPESCPGSQRWGE
jgi:hypothetical protein